MKKITALLLTLLLLSGCSLGKQAYVPTGDALHQDSTADARPTQPPVSGDQILTLSYNPDGTFNPYTETDLSNRLLFSLLYQGLFSVDMNYNVAPVLCKSYSVSKDMKSYTFYLEDATFSDGSTLTAQDVLASLNAARENPVYSGRFTHVKTISATEDGGICVTLGIAYADLPILLDIPIVKASTVGAKWPLGTGPYLKEEALTGPRLVRSTAWWCTANLAATAASISLLEVDSTAMQRDDFEFGNVSLVCADPGSDNYVDFRCDYELWDCENGIFLYLACNEKSKVFSSAKLRSALTYAIDREYLVNAYYGDFAAAATLPASPGSPYYSEKMAAQYAYDQEKCLQMVQSSSIKNLEITLLVNSADSRRIRVAGEIADMLQAVGFKVTLKKLSGSSYKNALNKGNYDLHLGQTKLSANMDLSVFFAPKGTLNYGGLSDAATYSLCQEAMANAGNYYTLHQKIMSDGMLCPILFRSYAVYGQRGLFDTLYPARDNVFWYDLGKTMEDARIQETT